MTTTKKLAPKKLPSELLFEIVHSIHVNQSSLNVCSSSRVLRILMLPRVQIRIEIMFSIMDEIRSAYECICTKTQWTVLLDYAKTDPATKRFVESIQTLVILTDKLPSTSESFSSSSSSDIGPALPPSRSRGASLPAARSRVASLPPSRSRPADGKKSSQPEKKGGILKKFATFFTNKNQKTKQPKKMAKQTKRSRPAPHDLSNVGIPENERSRPAPRHQSSVRVPANEVVGHTRFSQSCPINASLRIKHGSVQVQQQNVLPSDSRRALPTTEIAFVEVHSDYQSNPPAVLPYAIFDLPLTSARTNVVGQPIVIHAPLPALQQRSASNISLDQSSPKSNEYATVSTE